MTTSTILERLQGLLRNTPPFDQLPAELMQEVLADLTLEYFEAGEVIIEQGSTAHKGLYVVESGMVRLMDLARQRLIDKCGEGDTFGAFGLIKGGAAPYEARAVAPTVCVRLRPERFLKLYEQNAAFATFFDREIKHYLTRQNVELDVTGARQLFSRRLRQLAYRRLVSCDPEALARDVARQMIRRGVSSVVVLRNGRLAGIVTGADLRRLVARRGSPETPVRRLMSTPVHTIKADASLFEAMMQMLIHGVHRLVVVDEQEHPVGVLTDRDIAHWRGQDPLATVNRIESITNEAELTNIREEIHDQLLRLQRQGATPEALGRLLSVMSDRIARRVIRLVERELRAREEELRVDLPWAWLRLGETGRQEMTLTTAQQNALVYADSEEANEKAEAWFGRLAEKVNGALEKCGFPASATIAREPQWRQSLHRWRQAIRYWILQATSEELAQALPFFDMRPLCGEDELMQVLWQEIEDALNVQALDRERNVLQILAHLALRQRPPLGPLGRWVTERSGPGKKRIDLDGRGIRLVVDAARVLALDLRYFQSTNTFDRLRAAAEAFSELESVLHNALEAYHYLTDVRLEHQLRQVEAGELPHDYLDPEALSRVQQKLLREALEAVGALQQALAQRYGVTLT
jgi:CBS domain-containing protein